MRSAWLLTMALLAASFAAPAASAAGASKPFLQDGTGDTTFNVAGAPTGVPVGNQAVASADLLSLDLQETDMAYDMTLQVAGFSSSVDFSQYQVHFDFRNMSYTAFVTRQILPTGDHYVAGDLTAVSSDDKGNYYSSYGSYVASLVVKEDAANAKLSFEIQKAYVLDGLKRLPSRGDNFTNIYVESQDSLFCTGCGSVEDRMPDADAVRYTVQIGDESHGHLSLSSPDRIRVSNGGAATFVYTVTLSNNADSTDTVDLALRDMPAGWNGTVETPIKVPGHGLKTFSVLASVPFAHVHGGFSAFNLSAQSQTDPNSNAVLRMGILHTPIPQPAGHHSEIYIHPDFSNSGVSGTVFPYTTGVMNTEAPKPEEASQQLSMGYTPDNANGWYIPLNPQLQIGIDMDLARTGSIAGNIVGHTVGSATVSAKLVLVRTDNGGSKPLVLAKSNSQDVSLSLNTASPFKLQMTPTPESDYIPFDSHQNLGLIIDLSQSGATPYFCCISSNEEPTLQVDGFKMVLPLNEYADRLTGISEAASAVDLKADGPVEKAGRPGTLLTYTFDLQNTGFTDDTFVLETAGTDAKRGNLVPNGEVTLAAKETKQVTLGVSIPPDFKDGQSLEVLVFAHAKSDPSKMALARTKTTVATTGNASSDETKVFLAAKNDAKKSPGPDAIMLLGAAGVALVVLG